MVAQDLAAKGSLLSLIITSSDQHRASLQKAVLDCQHVREARIAAKS
jgi:heme exporter protein D